MIIVNRLKLSWAKFGSFLFLLFLVLTVQRIIFLFTAKSVVFHFEPSLSDFIVGTFLDLGWSFLIILLGHILDSLTIPFRRFPRHIFKWIAIVLAIVLTYFLDNYFLSSSSLLSNMILMFSIDQLIELMAFEDNISWSKILWFVALIVSIIGFYKWLYHRAWIQKRLFQLIIICSGISGVFLLIHQDLDVPNVYSTNKSYYFIHSLYTYDKDLNSASDVNPASFKNLDPLFLGKKELNPFDLLTKQWKNTSDLTPHFKINPSGKAPNICIIIVESLSTSLVGEYSAKTGKVMPFLDSLSTKSLYFPNGLSTAHRTHHVLPAILASLPHSNEHTFFQEEEYPEHVGIVNMTKSEYYSSYYCGLELNFNQMDRFVRYNNVDYLSNNYNGVNKQENEALKDYWGYPDHIVFREFLKEKQERIQAGKYERKSSFDILLTLSTHEPFNYPDKIKHTKFVQQQLKKTASSKWTTYLKGKTAELGAFHYTDESLKQFFEEIKKTPDYENTIFIITGDHGSTILYENAMSKYHVPILIYSPLLKHPKKIPYWVSHLDIAPTLMNFLRLNYKVNVPNHHTFLGNEITLKKREKRALIFKGQNIMVRDLLIGNTAFLEGQLYKLTPSLKPIKITNAKQSKLLLKQAAYMRMFNHYVVEQNHLITQRTKPPKKLNYRTIPAKESKGEFLDLFEIPTSQLKKHDVIIDITFFIDSTLSKQLPELATWLKVGSSIAPSKTTFEKLMYGKYVQNGKNTPIRATVHFYISKEEIAKMDKTQKMKCFFHNVDKMILPFSKVSWSVQQ